MTNPKTDSSWLCNYSFQLQTVDPNRPLNDLEPIKALIGSARIVGMGEATHGSKEFTLVRHRILKYLVEEMDFKGLVLETPEQQAKAINEYIKTGNGNAKKLLSNLGYWVHNTQEMLDVIVWMKEYNHQHPSSKISFYGCDIPADDKRRNQEFGARDKAMADNCLKVLKEIGAGSKLVLWSHNFHIYHSGDLNTQGSYLKKKLANNYFAFVSLCNKGAFNAFLWDRGAEQTSGFHTFHLKPAHRDAYEHMFAETKQPLAIFDVRKIRNQAVTKQKQLKKFTVREVGSVYTPDEPETFEHKDDLFNMCDGIIWVNTVTTATSFFYNTESVT